MGYFTTQCITRESEKIKIFLIKSLEVRFFILIFCLDRRTGWGRSQREGFYLLLQEMFSAGGKIIIKSGLSRRDGESRLFFMPCASIIFPLQYGNSDYHSLIRVFSLCFLYCLFVRASVRGGRHMRTMV